MSQVVTSKTYCLENSNDLTRPDSKSFYHIDGSNAPIIIDKHQAKRLYRLQRARNVNTSLHLDSSAVNYDTQGYFEGIIRKQVDESSVQPTISIYHRPTDMSDISMARFSLGKARLDPQRIIPSEMITVRNHPSAITILRHEQDSNHEIVPRFTDRVVCDRTVRARLGPGGTVNPDEDCKQTKNYLRTQSRYLSQPNLNYNQRKLPRTITNELRRDELARHFMYTSVQQAASDEVPWDSISPSKLPYPLTTYELHGSDPLLKSKSLLSLYDNRTHKILEWDRKQLRNTYFYRKPSENIAPLPRAQQISGYSGSIGGNHIQDIDNPIIDFKPYTIVRTEQPKFSINTFKTNIPFYTGNSHWTKTEPVSHYDQSGHAYTTTGAFHKSLPLDYSSYRHTGLHGQLSRSVTTVLPQNPFNQIDISSKTVNASLDSRSHVVLRQLPAKSLPPITNNIKTEQTIVSNDITT